VQCERALLAARRDRPAVQRDRPAAQRDLRALLVKQHALLAVLVFGTWRPLPALGP